jgi:hypothetical protein
MDTHPSFLELDRAALGQGAPLTADHVKGCPRCQAHLKTLEEPIAVPAWATALRRPQTERKPSWWALVLLGAAADADRGHARRGQGQPLGGHLHAA